MSLISMIVVLLILGLVMHLINTYIPMDAKIKVVMNVVVVIVLCLWLLRVFLPEAGDIRIGP